MIQSKAVALSGTAAKLRLPLLVSMITTVARLYFPTLLPVEAERYEDRLLKMPVKSMVNQYVENNFGVGKPCVHSSFPLSAYLLLYIRAL